MIAIKVVAITVMLLFIQNLYSAENKDENYRLLSSVNPNVLCSDKTKKPSKETVDAFKKGAKKRCTKKT